MRLLKYFLVIAAIGLVSLAGTYYYFTRNLPSLATLEGYHPDLVTNVYSRDGRLIGEFYVERRVLVPLNSIPPHLIKAFLAAEDAKFYEHEGIDYTSIVRAFVKNLRAGKVVQGGSTITQQLAKTLLSNDRKLARKIKEAILAYRIERDLTKDEILSLYLNQIYFGNGAYGVETAAESYFGKNVEDVDIAESAMLAGLPKAPSKYSPRANFELAKKRQEFVIERMLEEGFITQEQADKAVQEKIRITPKKIDSLWVGPYFTEHVRRYIEEKYGEDALYKGGLKVYTTLDVDMQKAANAAVDEGLRAHDKRRGYRGPIKTLTTDEEMTAFRNEWSDKLGNDPLEAGGVYNGLVTEVNKKTSELAVDIGTYHGVIKPRDMRWARLYNPTDDPDGGIYENPINIFHKGDVIEVKIKSLPAAPADVIPLKLEQEPQAEASLFAMEPSTGAVRAMVGGSDFGKTQFNRAVQAYRQPGSSFKPIIYTAAIDKGFTTASIVVDSPIVFGEDGLDAEKTVPLSEDTGAEDAAAQAGADQPSAWRPSNYDEKFWGPITVRDALRESRNVVTIKILKKIGIDYAISYARLLGISAPLSRDLSLALGTSALTLQELTTAYATLDNMGSRPDPMYITKIVDREGNVLEENRPFARTVVSPQTAYIMTSMLQTVIERGTGMRARALGRPAAGKTGTTNSLNDAWFIGYVPGLAAGSWVGYDEEKPLGRHETGSRAALPIWLKFMQTVTADKPVENFQVPDGVEFARIDPKTGLLATPSTPDPVFEVFKSGTTPKAAATKAAHPHSADFFLIDTNRPTNNDIINKNIDNPNETGPGANPMFPATGAIPPAGTDPAAGLSGSAEGLPSRTDKLDTIDLRN